MYVSCSHYVHFVVHHLTKIYLHKVVHYAVYYAVNLLCKKRKHTIQTNTNSHQNNNKNNCPKMVSNSINFKRQHNHSLGSSLANGVDSFTPVEATFTLCCVVASKPSSTTLFITLAFAPTPELSLVLVSYKIKRELETQILKHMQLQLKEIKLLFTTLVPLILPTIESL